MHAAIQMLNHLEQAWIDWLFRLQFWSVQIWRRSPSIMPENVMLVGQVCRRFGYRDMSLDHPSQRRSNVANPSTSCGQRERSFDSPLIYITKLTILSSTSAFLSLPTLAEMLPLTYAHLASSHLLHQLLRRPLFLHPKAEDLDSVCAGPLRKLGCVD